MKKAEKQIQEYLFSQRDEGYAAFQAKLMPGVPKESVIGVRTPILKAYAKELMRSTDKDIIKCRKDFMACLPHCYFDENQLHAFLISLERDFEKCLVQAEAFFPYIDNWATCDQLNPKVFGKHTGELDGKIEEWMQRGHTYTKRFAIRMRMNFFLGENFRIEDAERIAAVRSKEYYINMMVAWYFATALAKQYEAVLPILQENRLDAWTQNKTIQKAVESYRITPEQKIYLRTLKR